MQDICNFIPPNPFERSLQLIHFVYESNIRKLKQPFKRPNFYINLVNKGKAVFNSGNKKTTLKKGDVFFTFPYQSFFLEDADDFSFLYISFNGEGALPLLNSLNINKDRFLFKGFDHLLQFWMDAIIRVNHSNASLLAESVLTHTLSYLDDKSAELETKDKFDFVLAYIDHNFASKDMSIKKVAEIFFYNKKYLSSLFVKKTGLRFSQHLNNLRITYAKKLIKDGQSDISEISYRCGYSDYFYFSKVFKKIVGKTPTQYLESM